jgi:hypothetical protein
MNGSGATRQTVTEGTPDYFASDQGTRVGWVVIRRGVGPVQFGDGWMSQIVATLRAAELNAGRRPIQTPNWP